MQADSAPADSGSCQPESNASAAAPSPVSCFSYLASVQTLQVDQFPDLNYGVDITSSDQFLAGDGPLVAGALHALGHRAVLGTNHVADDAAGREVLSWLRAWGIAPAGGPPPAARTRVNIVACDRAGNRTWFSGLRGVDAELESVDVPLLAASPAVYIDCYEVLGDAPRALLAASLAAGADVTLNLGGSPPPGWLAAETRRRRASVIQTNASESAADGARRVLSALTALDAADTVVVTVGRHGAIARTSSGETASADALAIPVQQVQGAGSVFSAALIHSRSTGAGLGACLRYACAAGSLWCGTTPSHGFPRPEEIERALTGGQDGR
jgi:sugar/nucleoside kinase (ribokinase family)